MASIPRTTAARRWKYDVYLSYWDLDTRRGFTSHLYGGLQRRGIKTFMGYQDLQVGDEIYPTLLKVIEGSKLAIVVLSQNYASSAWCLDELTKICQFMEDGHRILPVFYDVKPSDVRNQKRSLEDAFTKHERFESEKVKQWRDALRKVADFAGLVPNYRTERDLVEATVEFVYSKLQHVVEINTGDFEATRQATIEIEPAISRQTAASLPSSAEPSSTACQWKYDVYLSFLGADTRNSFTDHLYYGLQHSGLSMNQHLEREHPISPSLVEAIEESRFAIVVMSKSYVHYTWCLEELTKIYECMKNQNRILPIFYNVANVDVRYCKTSFEKAFQEHESSGQHTSDKMKGWKDASNHVVSLCGWQTKNYKTDRELVETIVDFVCRQVKPIEIGSTISTNWKKGHLLGSGSFGSVYEGISDGGCFIAVKEVSLLDQGKVSQLEQEIALLSQCKHENIVQYYGTQKDESKLYIFLELVTKGSLQKLYQTYPLTDLHVSVYTRQILQGLKYLHGQNVIHRDIKCANILVHANGSVKLADFGLAKTIKMNDKISCRGTANWMAPEVVEPENPGYGLPADIWSLGCTVLEMLTRMVPYPNLEWMAALWKIMKGEPPLVPDSLSREAQDFIHLCLQVEPDNRPTAAQLLKHPFVNKPLPPTSSGSLSPYNHHRQS
ncbi:hypothetical protein ABKV19_002725 [Rosa sericea]